MSQLSATPKRFKIPKMPSPSLSLQHHQLGFHRSLYSSSATQKLFLSPSIVSNFPKPNPRNVVVFRNQKYKPEGRRPVEAVKGKKENVWSLDNELAAKSKDRTNALKRQRGRRVLRKKKKKNGSNDGRHIVMVSGAMLMEIETVLQTQEPVIKPAWNTFASSVSGIWKGVGAVFSPITAEMEPVEIGNKNENLYDCYTCSRIEVAPSAVGGKISQIQRKINWVTLNPYGEMRQQSGDTNRIKDGNGVGDASISMEAAIEETKKHWDLPKFESFDFEGSDVMEEDIMGNEPGLVYFEDGSYSRGPVDIPVGDTDDSEYFLSPTFKFEQCLVKGCHMRLRIVHTIEFSNGGPDIQILRVAFYEEEWVGPANIHDDSDMAFNATPLSFRKRTQPSQLTGSWKVFEVSATPVFGEDVIMEDANGSPYVYLCTETLKTRSLPDNPIYFREEEMLDLQDVTMLWLPGGVTAYVDVRKDGTLCIGVGWCSDEGINLVMERDYGVDGKLKEVRWKSELKRRWSEPLPV